MRPNFPATRVPYSGYAADDHQGKVIGCGCTRRKLVNGLLGGTAGGGSVGAGAAAAGSLAAGGAAAGAAATGAGR